MELCTQSLVGSEDSLSLPPALLPVCPVCPQSCLCVMAKGIGHLRNKARHKQLTLEGSTKTPMKLAMGRRPRDLLDPASMNPEQLTSTPTKQDLLNEEIQKLATKTRLDVQQREDIRRHLAERMKFVPIHLRVGENVFTDQSKIQ